MVLPGGGSAGGYAKPAHEVADIFLLHGAEYVNKYGLTPERAKVMRAIVSCRTAALGGHLYKCLDCGFRVELYNSCRDRHCPKCLGMAQARWLKKRQDTILPTPYFHVVFTLPAELRSILASQAGHWASRAPLQNLTEWSASMPFEF